MPRPCGLQEPGGTSTYVLAVVRRRPLELGAMSAFDRWIDCDETAIVVRSYYFPWGTKRIAYDAIRSAVIVPIASGSGQGRIWGTTNLSYWASLDPQRPSKGEASSSIWEGESGRF
jgi:hypothetical protein